MAILLAASVVAASACSKSEPAPKADPAAKPGTPDPARPDPAKADPARPDPAAAKAPMRMEFAATAAAALGTVPSGYGLAVGSKVPGVSVQDLEGKPVELASLIAKGPVLLVFYRGGWCPFCNSQVYETTRAYPEFQKRGVTPVMISVDRPDEAAKTSASYEVPFPILSDPDLAAHEAFHVIHQVEAEELQTLSSYGIDLEQRSGRDHHKFAVPSIFLIDAAGAVKWAHVDPDYKVRPKTEQILAVLDAQGFPPK